MKSNVKRMRSFVFLLIAILMLTACGTSNSKTSTDENRTSDNQSKGKITVGGKDFTEQHILTKITSIYLKEKGYDVKEATNMGSTVVRQALENGQIDLYWEYTGTALVIYNHQPVETDPDAAYEKVKEIDQKKGLVWLNKAELNNTYAIMMLEKKANELGIKTISDLADYVNNHKEIKFASNAEFYARQDGLRGLEKKYEFKFQPKNVIKMETGLLPNALKEGQVDASIGTSTDGRIKEFNLIILEDDKHYFPAYNAAPVVREESLEKNEELADQLNELSSRLNSETLIQLNYMVDVEHKDVAEVAREWLTSQNLIK
ncbi:MULTISPECIES: glycine betaine ABC transporter substrate-binding protein [Aeribacillus]|jgi:osmoprotectant transport system substrate-binding protein|uniref:glycine betaine ABC transporter substrate-binding protein n=1 Tax=Aeribacillus TaxID=1055323 RepID=UPI001F5DD900|nr:MULTISPECIES: glycine betaine ABC transporter substrate-binding protein [Aeribacillus]MED0652090.1 glycine betaine ABC transporter substrate-binding protein [Aeribacillus composti]MED0703886.1 glycine betaine ABC transporter substrate-binding protein [Aeribacillus composti]MED1440442.1 glycine betaine ABC transporter substrate-binding protein [Aeribacillus composti]MED4488564.1 glycine betaine ABC transporter substrate-binding protein [Aeribacillus pallidus]